MKILLILAAVLLLLVAAIIGLWLWLSRPDEWMRDEAEP